MELLIVSFIAGMLTVLAPCSITLLPVILGGSVVSNDKARPFIIIISLSISIFVFGFILQLLSSFITIDFSTRRIISGAILIILGLFFLFPRIWDTISLKLNLNNSSGKALNESSQKRNFVGSILTGFALGPVFTTCSPTFGYILAVIVGQEGNVGFGLLNIITYILGLDVILLLVTIFGQWFVSKIKWAANPEGNFRKVLGILFILIGISIALQFDKAIEAFIIQSEFFENFNVGVIDQQLLENILNSNER